MLIGYLIPRLIGNALDWSFSRWWSKISESGSRSWQSIGFLRFKLNTNMKSRSDPDLFWSVLNCNTLRYFHYKHTNKFSSHALGKIKEQKRFLIKFMGFFGQIWRVPPPQQVWRNSFRNLCFISWRGKKQALVKNITLLAEVEDKSKNMYPPDNNKHGKHSQGLRWNEAQVKSWISQGGTRRSVGKRNDIKKQRQRRVESLWVRLSG